MNPALLLPWLFLGLQESPAQELESARRALAAGQTEMAITALEPLASADDPRAWLLLAKAYRQSHRLEKGWALAESLAARFLAGEITLSAELAQAMAPLFAEQGRLARAQEVLSRALRVYPEEPDLHLEQARLHFSLLEYSAAVEACRKAQALGKDSSALYYVLGTSLAVLGERAEAEPTLQRSLEKNPRHVDARFELAKLKLRAKEYAKAIAELKRCLVLQPRHLAALFNLGNALVQSGNREEGRRTLKAFQHYNRLAEQEKDLRDTVRVNREDQQALVELALFYVNQKQPRRALPLLERAMARELDRTELLVGFGKSLSAVGRDAEARDTLTRALQLDAKLTPVRILLVEILARLNELDAAGRMLASCKKQVSPSRWFLAQGEIAARRGLGWEGAAPAIRKSIEADPSNLEAILAWVDLAVAYQKVALAESALRAWGGAHPRNPRFPLGLGVLALEGKRTREALQALDTARRLDPWFPATHTFLAQWYRRTGDLPQSLETEKHARYLQILWGQSS
ncbi:MAG: tetratricopeptide repeat protein, partial [Planctomycetota bacterium]